MSEFILRLSKFSSMEALQNKTISFVNPYSYYVLRKCKFPVGKVDVWFSDGVLICWLVSLFRLKVDRASFDFTSLAGSVLSWVKENDKSLCVVGSDEDSIAYFSRYLSREFKLNLLSYRNGYFSDVEYTTYLSVLNRLNPDVVVVGMGTPQQEQFLLDLRSLGWKGIGFTCGGFIHQTKASEGAYYPRVIDKLNLRFLYRMWREPNTIRRYLTVYPYGVSLIVRDLLSRTLLGTK